MDRSHTIAAVLCIIECGTSTPATDASVDGTIQETGTTDEGGADVIDEWKMCSFDGAFHGDEAGVGQHYSCCAGVLCYGDCLVDGGPPRCDCGGINGGCENPSRCCGELYADVVLLSCNGQCVKGN